MSSKGLFTRIKSKFVNKQVSNVAEETKKSDDKWGSFKGMCRHALTTFPSVLYVLIVSVGLAFIAGYGIGNHFRKTAEIVNVVSGTNQFQSGTADSQQRLPVETPVPLGERIKIRRDFEVVGTEEVLNCIQAIGTKTYKVNYGDKYYTVSLNMPGALAFVLHQPEDVEIVHTQFLFPMNAMDENGQWGPIMEDFTVESLEEYLPEVFNEVKDIKIVDNKVYFVAGDIQLSGYWGYIQGGPEKYVILSMVEEKAEPDDYCGNYLQAMQQSVDYYYNQLYPKPTEIAGDPIDKSAFIQGQGVLVCSPRSGFDQTVVGKNFTVLEMHNTDTFGNSQILFTTSQQDIYGFYEALESVASDIAYAYDDMTETKGNVFSIERKEPATWSNVEAYYMEGTIGTKRCVTYVFYNPLVNNYGTISAIVEKDDFGVNGERLVNAMSERIEFVGG